MIDVPVIARTTWVLGIELPWQEIKRYDPEKGTVLREGRVFVEMSTLYAVSEQGVWESQFGNVLLLDYLEGLALEAAGLAEQETRGGYHTTELLTEFLREYEARSVAA